MSWIRRLLGRTLVPGQDRPGSFSLEAHIERTEELRVDRLGPTEEQIAEETAWEPPPDPWRPKRTLG